MKNKSIGRDDGNLSFLGGGLIVLHYSVFDWVLICVHLFFFRRFVSFFECTVFSIFIASPSIVLCNDGCFLAPCRSQNYFVSRFLIPCVAVDMNLSVYFLYSVCILQRRPRSSFVFSYLRHFVSPVIYSFFTEVLQNLFALSFNYVWGVSLYWAWLILAVSISLFFLLFYCL